MIWYYKSENGWPNFPKNYFLIDEKSVDRPDYYKTQSVLSVQYFFSIILAEY
jgi:hypothetical protein